MVIKKKKKTEDFQSYNNILLVSINGDCQSMRTQLKQFFGDNQKNIMIVQKNPLSMDENKIIIYIKSYMF